MLEPENLSFGNLLRFYRERAIDKRARARLSQELFAMRLSEKTGLRVTRNRVGNWEADKTPIAVNDRDLLLSILAVLHEGGGLTSLDEANELLEAGNYRSLNPVEVQQIFFLEQPDPPPPQPPVQEADSSQMISSTVAHPFLNIWEEWQRIRTDAQAGPQPNWPHVLVALTNKALQGWTVYDSLRVFAWIWLWAFTWWLIAPSMRWPFGSQQSAIVPLARYAAGTIFLPLGISFLAASKSREFWKQQKQINRWVLYLYTYQGAGIGFHLGYFAAFLIALVVHHLHLRAATWFEVLLVLFPLVLSYVGSQLVPYNLWRAYERLHLADGAIFFMFLFVGPIWGYFFLYFHSYFLTPIIGVAVILIAATSLAIMMAWRHKHTGSTLIPSYWWSLIYGFIFVLYEINTGESWYNVTTLAGVMILLSVLVARKRVRFTLKGMLLVTVGLVLLLLALEFNLWMGRILAFALILIWWRWESRLLSFPSSFWVVIFTVIACGWALKQGFLSDIFASIVVAAITLLVLVWEWRR